MFHDYVIGSLGQKVDIGRARFLMVQAIAEDAAAWVNANLATLAEWRRVEVVTEEHKNQAFWDYYCQRHFERYGEPFPPSISHSW